MTKFLRSMAVAAACAGCLPSIALATDLPLDFEKLNLPSLTNLGTVIPGLEFSTGATVIDDTGFSPKPPSGSGFLYKLPTGTSGAPASFTLTVLQPSVTTFDSLSFQYFGNFEVRVFDVNGNLAATRNVQASGGTTVWESPVLGPIVVDKLNFSLIQHIDFIGREFALDNLRLFQTASTGGSVPEPAGLALSAVALMCMGLASRRRKG